MVLVRVWIWLSIWLVADGKIYRRCDLVKELRNFDVPEEEIGTWVCIARHESNYDTEAMNPGSGDHGLFQISQLYWCSPPGDGYGCNSPCEKFRDDDIGDDLQCVRRIFREHKRISGNGFNAWVVYPLYCAQNTTQYVQDCSQEPSGPAKPTNGTDNEISVEEEGDGYHFPALPSLAKEPLQKDRAEKQLPFSKVSIHYSIPVNKGVFRQLPFNKHSIHHFIPLIGGSDQSYPTNEPSESTTSMKENDDSPVTMTELLELEPTTTKRRFSTSTKNRSSEPLLASSSIPLGSIARKAKNESSPTTPLLAFRSSAAQTTETPEGRQVTFAPGSFFSWIFNSQTLPPILPPARPPRPQGGPARPPTMRPGGGRPGQGPGPNRPDGLLTTRRPLPIRPSPMGHPHRRRPGGAPVLVSFPHLLYADSRYLDKVEGLNPDPSKHAMFVTLEPTSGTPLKVAKRVQFNLLLRAVRNITSLETVGNSIVPMFWIEESTALPEKYQDFIKNKIYRTLLIMDIVRYTVLALALAVIVCCIVLFIYAT